MIRNVTKYTKRILIWTFYIYKNNINNENNVEIWVKSTKVSEGKKKALELICNILVINKKLVVSTVL